MSSTRLIRFSVVLAWLVVALGAYVRLSDAGLACPDWPGCYGQLGAPVNDAQRRIALAAFPGQPVEVHKAWKEMLHRYAAGTLGLAILGIFVLAWREKGAASRLAAALLALVSLQALLGRWTVTHLLSPAIVSAHLLGGMATLALLVWLGWSRKSDGAAAGAPLRRWAAIGLLAVAGQIALGGWTSAHYAGLACGADLTCRGSWAPAMDFGAGFSLARAASLEALTAIHWSHRIGALLVTLILLPLAGRLLGAANTRFFGRLVLGLLLLQLGLGIANVGWGLPLSVGVLHNAVAALLLAALVALNRHLHNPGGNPP